MRKKFGSASGMGEKFGSGMNISDHFSESLETVELKILTFFNMDPDPGFCQNRIRDGKNRIRDKRLGSATLTGRRGSSPVPRYRRLKDFSSYTSRIYCSTGISIITNLS
jgi:hypothetical protein